METKHFSDRDNDKNRRFLSPLWLISFFIAFTGLAIVFLNCIGIQFRYDPQTGGTSLPWRYYLILPLHWPFSTEIKPGDYIAFRTDKRVLPYYRPGVIFGKRVIGVPGDRLEVKGRDFYINGRWIARARETDSLGNPAPLFKYNGRIPEGCYFVLGHHPRSFDSRYWGFVYKKAIIGKLYPLGGRKD